MAIIQPASLTSLTDLSGKSLSQQITAVDVSNLIAYMLQAALTTAFVPSDIAQFSEWIPGAQGIIQGSNVAAVSASGTPNNGGFGSFGYGGGSFGVGSGLLQRGNLFQSEWYAWLNWIRTVVNRHATIDGNATSNAALLAVSDLISYAAYFNNAGNPGGSAFSTLYSPDFATLYWYANSKAQQLAPACVFAPAGIVLGHFAVTGTNAGTLSNNAATNWPSANGYGTPAPTTTGGVGTTFAGTWSSATTYTVSGAVLTPVVLYSGLYYVAVATSTNITPGTDITKWVVCTFGNPVYLGGMPMPQAFAPIKTPACLITTNINGTCVATVTAKKQDGVTNENWTATLSSATAGQIINLTPTIGGDRMNSSISAIAISGTATAGAFDVVSTAERTP